MSVHDELKQPEPEPELEPDSPSASEDAATNTVVVAVAAAEVANTPTHPKLPELLGCDEHPHGRPAQSRECPKCDTVLSSARSLGGHMTMSHSRNACKALKCPKCNWSYKYQETLEIHMKEKHPETNSQCVYCASCQPHPRLARGESYSCGYKPYRCEICNYSTTTKGNLSIHMQSDKHINNVQELQNSAAVAAALAAAASINGQPASPPACSNCNKASCECSKATPQTPTVPELLPAIAIPTPANNQPTPDDVEKRAIGKPKAVSRCDVCKYETTVPRNLRIHMTSEKHLHNVAIQTQPSSQQPCSKTDPKPEPEPPSAPAPAPTRAAEPTRADSSPGAALQELLAQLAQTRSTLPSSMPMSLSPSLLPLLGINGLSGLNAAATAALMMNSFGVGVANLGSFAPLASGSVWADLLAQGSASGSGSGSGSSSAADWLRLHAAAAVLSAAYNNSAGSSPNSGANAPGPLASPPTPAPPTQPAPVPTPVTPKERRNASNSQKLYHCSICNVFSSESLEELQEHIQLDRTNAKQPTGVGATLQYDPETVQIANGTFMCKLCTYKTTLKANFQLHCKTDKHLQRVQLVNHIKEGGALNDWRLQALLNPAAGATGGNIAAQTALSNLIQIRCVACDCCTNLLHKLQIHSQTPLHHFNARLFHHLADCEAPMHAGRKLAYKCALCAACENSRTALIAHANSPQHARQLALRCGCASLNDTELLQQNSKFIDLFRVDYDDGVGGANAPDSQLLLQASVKCEPIMDGSNGNGNGNSQKREAFVRASSQVSPSAISDINANSNKQFDNCNAHQNQTAAGKPKVACPLCENQVPAERYEMEEHLMKTHNVTKEGLHRLLALVSFPAEGACSSKCELLNPVATDTTHSPAESSCDVSDAMDAAGQDDHDKYRCQMCSRQFLSIDALYSHQAELDHLEVKQTPYGPGYLCWKKGCNQYFRSAEAVQTHFREIHDKAKRASLSTQTSVNAHPTVASSNGNSNGNGNGNTVALANSNRLTTFCAICTRNFRSVLALRKHVETIHQNQADSSLTDRARCSYDAESIDAAADSGSDADSQLEAPCDAAHKADTDTPVQLLKRAADCLGTKCTSTQLPKTLQAPPAQAPVLNGSGGGRYLDPNRPFKCDVCRESFTQRSILLGHFKSVSHLHKLKRQKSETTAEQQRGDSDSDVQRETAALAYKCNLCKQYFSDSASLSAHVKSQTHQSRLSRLYELIAMGEYDLSKPLIENPDDLMKVLWNSLMVAAQKSSTPGSSSGNLLESFTNRVSLAAQSAPGLTSPTCLTLPNSFTAQNKQSDADKVEMHASKVSPNHIEKPSVGVDHGVGVTPTRNSLRLPVSFRKSLMQFGLEQVTQFLESAAGDAKENRSDEEENEKDEKSFVCTDCEKCFSSALVLKCHREFQHNDFMQSDALVQVASCLQDGFEKRLHLLIAQESAQQENANATVATNSPILSPCRVDTTVPNAVQDTLVMHSSSGSDVATNNAPQQPKMVAPPSAVAAVKTLLTHRKVVPVTPVSVTSTPTSLQASLLEKRARTRITDEQLRVLRAHFNINNSPSEDEIVKMSEAAGLAQKVIKHWFRNTLFKERQRNKDSPYNFSVPPVTSLNLEEYERTGQIKVAPLEPSASASGLPHGDAGGKRAHETHNDAAKVQTARPADTRSEQIAASSFNQMEEDVETHESLSFTQSECTDDTRECFRTGMLGDEQSAVMFDKHSDETRSVDNESYSTVSLNGSRQRFSRSLSAFASSSINEFNAGSFPHNSKRANRTRFSDEQLAVLQDYFETKNAYPKDEELEQLSRKLALNARVIVVWFQNQRQKKHRAKHSLSGAPESSNETSCQQSSNEGVSNTAMLEALSRVVVKRRYDDDELVVEEGVAQSEEDELSDPETERQNGDDKLRRVDDSVTTFEERPFGKDRSPNKRLRTTISPEQLDFLYQQYQQDSNPTRKRIEEIAESVKLRKRVVQVWFQNARARTRKELQAQIMKRNEVVTVTLQSPESVRNCITSPNSSGMPLPVTPKRTCPHCPAQFRARSALSSHLKTKHADLAAVQQQASSSSTTATVEQVTANNSNSNSNINMEDNPKADHVFNTIDDVLASTLSPAKTELAPAPAPTPTPTPTYADEHQELEVGKLQRMISSSSVQIEDNERKLVICDDVADDRMEEQNDSNAQFGSTRSRDSSPDGSLSDKLSSDMQVPNGVKAAKNNSADSHKRTRTQLSMTQIRVMKAIFKDYRTPTMHECETLGKDIGLPRRVVQVWYQNARAKERKAKVFGSFGISKKDEDEEKKDGSLAPTCTRCSLCHVDFVSAAQPSGETLQQHLFSAHHLKVLRQSLDLSCSKQASDSHNDSTKPERQSNALHKVRAKRLKLEAGDSSELHKAESVAGKTDGAREQAIKTSPHAPNSVSMSEASEANSNHNTSDATGHGSNSLLNPSMATASLLAASAAAANSVNFLSSLLSPTLNLALPFSPPSLPGLSVMPYMYAAAAAAAAAAINTAASNGATSNSSSALIPKASSTLPSWQQAQVQLDALNYGIPINLLQIPAAALKCIDEQVKSLERNAQKCSYTQDSNGLNDLMSAVNVGYVEMKPLEVGYICRACSLVFPKSESCLNHQRTTCSKIKELHDDVEQRIIRLEQLQYRCKVCNSAYNTTQDFLQHCTTERSSHQCLLK